jgi:hypothetical protein
MTVFQTGDYVLKEVDQIPSKLHFQFAVPYEVIQQYKNDVEVRNLVHGNVLTFPLDRLKPFFGSETDAFQSALLDNDQYAIDIVRAYRGDPQKRSQCVFLVRFMDGDEVWLPWSMDLTSTAQFEDFCKARPELYSLLYTLNELRKIIKDINKTVITEVNPGDTAYLNLRYYGSEWFYSLLLPDPDFKAYVVEIKYLKWFQKTTRTSIVMRCDLFNEDAPVNHFTVRSYGMHTGRPPDSILVDSSFIAKYPQVLPDDKLPNLG